MADVKVKYSNKENDLIFHWEDGCKYMANMLMNIFTTDLQRELSDAGFDLKTFRLSVNRNNPSTDTGR